MIVLRIDLRSFFLHWDTEQVHVPMQAHIFHENVHKAVVIDVLQDLGIPVSVASPQRGDINDVHRYNLKVFGSSSDLRVLPQKLTFRIVCAVDDFSTPASKGSTTRHYPRDRVVFSTNTS